MKTITTSLRRTMTLLFLAWAASQASAALKPGVTTFVFTGACWRYNDLGLDPGAEWANPGYDDSTWSPGDAELGYGDGDEATVVSFGPDPDNKYITTYFRRTFFVPDPGAFTNIVLRLKSDDGAEVYLNGVEVFRTNLPPGPLNYLTLATPAADDGTNFVIANLSSSLLWAEGNTIAVGIHQAATNDEDLSFDLELVGEYAAAPVLSVVSASGNSIVLAWPASASSNFVLQSASTIPGSFTEVTNEVAEADGRRYVTNPVTGAKQFYRLSATSLNFPPCQPPIVLSQPLKVAAPVGTNVTLSVVVAGDPTITYQWRKNERFIPGANTASLTLTNVQREDGGAYDVLVANPCVCLESCPIEVTVGASGPAPSDSFAARPAITGLAAQFNGSLNGFTTEAGEPPNPSSTATNTGWVEWTAGADGPVILDTAGSGFRTAIAVFRGTTLANLTLVATVGASEPDGTSRLQFTAASGTVYQLMFSGTGLGHNFAANLAQQAGNACAIAFLLQPQSQLVLTGATVNFTVIATNGDCSINPTLSYQWRRDSVDITGETNATLTLTNVTFADTAAYTVAVTNGLTSVGSMPGTLGVYAVTGPGGGVVTISTTEFTYSSGSCLSGGYSFKQFFWFRMADGSTASCNSGYGHLLLVPGTTIGNVGKLNVYTWMDGTGTISKDYNNGRDTAIQLTRSPKSGVTCLFNGPCANDLSSTPSNCCNKLSEGFMPFGIIGTIPACTLLGSSVVKVIVYYNAVPSYPVSGGTGCTSCDATLGTGNSVAIRWLYTP